MSEQEIKGKEKEEAAQGTEQGAAGDPKEGDKSEADKEIKRLHAETEGLNKAVAEKENAIAKAKIAGVTDAGVQPEKPKEETPAEYKDRVLKGEV